MIEPAKLFALTAEPAWKDAPMRDAMAEYMRRAAEERGEDVDAEDVSLDSSQPLKLRCALPGKTTEEANTILAQLQTMGLNGSLTLEPATVEHVRQVCDRICALAERMVEEKEEEESDPLGPFLDQLLDLNRQMRLALGRHLEDSLE